jgi:outer membrane protein OmpA-like peptidoglycan-associated protein
MTTASQLICALALISFSGIAQAADVSTEDIVCGLNPNCTRALSRDVRGIVATRPPDGTAPLSVNLYVNFAYDSAELTSDARITLDRLGYALVDDRLKTFTFMIEGHTDAKGSAEYNQGLSDRRAKAVMDYLVAQFGIDKKRLSARGFGKSRLLDPSRPEDGVNRRVQVLNMSAGLAQRGDK